MEMYQYRQETRSNKGLCRINKADIALAVVSLFLQAHREEQDNGKENKRAGTFPREPVPNGRREKYV